MSQRQQRLKMASGPAVVLGGMLLGAAFGACSRGDPGPAPDASVESSASAVIPSASASVAPARPPEPEWTAEDDVEPATIPEQREAMFRRMEKFLALSGASLAEIRRIFATQRWMGQGNPKATEHPMSRAECRKIRGSAKVVPEDAARCGARNMVPIFNRKAGETANDAKVCIDQFEFPNIACEYPVTWAPAHLAHELCLAQGKRMCDAHEWEGACAGSILPAADEYAWYARKGEKTNERRLAFEHLHNKNREILWAYGPEKNHAKCATGSRKSDGCIAPTWEKCGTNTYPAGAFPECVSPFGVYDLHGNAAEHMNLPMSEEELASRGNKLGQVEMKGSWFIFNSYEAHIDDCRWRAPNWHGGPVMAKNSHMNYHLGFRCCRDLPPREFDPTAADAGVEAGVIGSATPSLGTPREVSSGGAEVEAPDAGASRPERTQDAGSSPASDGGAAESALP